MTKTYDSVVKELDGNIPAEAVSKRDAGKGRSLSYLEGWYVIDRLNKVLGIGKWAYSAHPELIFSGKVDDKKFVASYRSQVRLVVEFPDGSKTEFVDTGFGEGTDYSSPSAPHELAIKGANTDGLKRCAKNLGMSMGLALYDKEQEFVDEALKTESKGAPSAPRPSGPATPGERYFKGGDKLSTRPIGGKVVTPQRSERPTVTSAGTDPKEAVIKTLSSKSKVLLDTKKATASELEEALKAYSVSSITELTFEQATSLNKQFSDMLNAPRA